MEHKGQKDNDLSMKPILIGVVTTVVGVVEAKAIMAEDMEEIMVRVIAAEVEVKGMDVHSINATVQMLGL